jgi:organic radical activating enzyme
MSRCTEDGIDMSMKVLKDSIEFIKKLYVNTINIGGGEPTMHPAFIECLKLIKNEIGDRIITLCTNGIFVRNEYLFNEIKELDILIQTTYNADLYKTGLTDEEINKLKDISVVVLDEPSKERLLEYGRALDNNLETSTTRISPLCFNIRSLVKASEFELDAAINRLEWMNKFCCPTIRPDGSISLSESLCCPSIGTIYDSIDTLTENIKKFNCTNCVYAKRLLNDDRYSSILK